MKICRPYITLRNGHILYAHQVGKKAFCWEVTEEENKRYHESKKKHNLTTDNEE